MIGIEIIENSSKFNYGYIFIITLFLIVFLVASTKNYKFYRDDFNIGVFKYSILSLFISFVFSLIMCWFIIFLANLL